MCLYIVPLISSPSYDGSTILAQQYLPSEYGDISSDSITSFSETLPDDTLFYPDSFVNTTPNLAIDGSGLPSPTGTYENTHQISSAFYTVDTSSPYACYLILEFSLPVQYALDSVSINVYGNTYSVDTSVTSHVLQVFNGTDYVTYGEIYDAGGGSSYDWTNYTITDPQFYPSNTVTIKAYCTDDALLTLILAYAEVTFSYMTLADDEHYAEGFTDVSDIEFYWKSADVGASDYGIETNEDVLTQWVDCDDANDESVVYKFDVTISTGLYYEMRGRECNSTANGYVALKNGATTVVTIDIAGTSWQTLKGWIPDTTYSTIDNIQFALTDGTNSYAGGIVAIAYDYLRISPANESGWQHDGSVTDGVEDSAYGGSVSSDGDYLSLIADADFSVFNFSIDTTSTQASYLPTYYPFLKIAINPSDVGNDLRLRVGYYDGSWNTLVNQFTTTQAIMYFNIRATSANAIRTIQLYGYSSQTTRVDYIKAYSIANYTVSQHASTTIGNYYYVNDDNDLVRVGNALTDYWIELNHDGAVSVDTSIYTVCDVIYSNLISGSGPHDYGIYTYIDGSGSWNYEAPFYLTSGTMTDYRIITYSSMTISAITFYDSRQWQEINSITIYIHIPFDYWAVDMLLILIGLAMAVFSTVYLSYKVTYDRDNINTDIILVVALLFMFGWGLFFGGIF